MRILHLSCLAFLAASCAYRPPPPGTVPTAPAKVDAVAPAVESYRRASNSSGATSAKLESQVNALSQQATSLRTGLEAATAEAQRLTQQKSATEKELNNLWLSLTTLTERNQLLEKEAAAANSTALTQQAMRAALETELDDLVSRANAKDSEAGVLRLQHADLSAEVLRLNGDITKLTAAKDKAEKSAAVGRYIKGCIWFLAIIAIAFIALKLYLPRLPVISP